MDKLKSQLPSAIAVVFTVSMLVGSFVWFSSNTDAMIESSVKIYLESNARSQAAAFNAKLSNLIEVLEQSAKYWESVDMTDFDDVVARMARVEIPKHFSKIAVADFSGHMVDNLGNRTDKAAELSYFQRARSGEVVVSDVVQTEGYSGGFLYIAVPIVNGSRVKGVVYAQFPVSLLEELMQTVGFKEASTSLLLSDDGTIISRSFGHELVTERITNFYDLGSSWGLKGNLPVSEIKIDMINEETFTVPYKTGSRGRLAILTPVGKNDWYYAIIISQDVIKRQSRVISMYMGVVILAISFAFAMLFVTILHLIRHNALIEKANERFRMATTQTQAIVFDYDFQKKLLVLNGNVKVIDKGAKESYSGDEILAFLKSILHENDLSVIDELNALRSNFANSLAREVRVRCSDGEHYWHRLTGTVVRDSEENPLRLVGNFINVEDEMNKDLQLKRKAEIDTLSGLLNKGAFTAHVSKILEDSTLDNLYAFYIIDLDNFKKVNDSLGHIVGDLVISDVAQKLCTVFSENDFVGRIGGDEFAAFLKLSGSGISMGRRIIESKASAACAIIDDVYSNDDSEVNVTASIGASLFPANGHSFEELYKAASEELSKSKAAGKNHYTIFDQEIFE